MKKYFSYTLLFLLGLGIGCLINLSKNSYKKEVKKYVYVGEEKTSQKLYREGLNEDGLVYEKGVDPLGVYNKKDGIVCTPDIAYQIANSILTNIYGEQDINERKPFKIKLINDKYWAVEGEYQGKDRNIMLTGSVFICIKKDDAQVQMISHEK